MADINEEVKVRKNLKKGEQRRVSYHAYVNKTLGINREGVEVVVAIYSGRKGGLDKKLSFSKAPHSSERSIRRIIAPRT